MPHEISIGGVLIPGLLPIFLISMVLMLLVDALIGRYGLHRYVWHPPLFRLALFACLFAVGGLLFLR
jgi:hypothetical protein